MVLRSQLNRERRFNGIKIEPQYICRLYPGLSTGSYGAPHGGIFDRPRIRTEPSPDGQLHLKHKCNGGHPLFH